MWKWTFCALAILSSHAALGAPAKPLSVGDPAPKLEVKEFVKGEPVTSLEKGKVYVMEFWATWCGPCRTSIPHVSELQKKHPEVTVIGVSVWERDPSAVKPFVEEMGDRMAYRVAVDAAGGQGESGKMAQMWMEAAGQKGIPAAFIVDREGKVAWIGHPMEMDQPLEKIVAGTWDIAAAAGQQRQAEAQQAKMQELRTKLDRAQQSGDPKQVLTVLDQAIAADPAMEPALGVPKFQVLIQTGQTEKAKAYGERLVGTVLKDEPQGLNYLAWSIVDPDAPKAAAGLVPLALKAAERADTLAGQKDPAIADTLAKAYFDSGNAAKALETQERAVKLTEGTPLENNPDLKARLEQYRKAVQKQ